MHKTKNNNFNLRFEPSASALARFNPAIVAAKQNDANVMNIYGEIGENWQGSGFTSQMAQDIVDKAKGKAITVNINSAGGSFFDGLAIYNILNEYEGDVTVNVLGMAASAASVIAMAGDNTNISEHGFMMIHNTWTIAMGNKSDMKEVSDMLDKFDASMANLYAKKTGLDKKAVAKMMDSETWLSGADAVEQGFAQALLEKDAVKEEKQPAAKSALREVDILLAKAGVPRSDRRELIKDLSGTPCAADKELPMPCAGDEKLSEALAGLLKSFKH